MKEHGNYAFFQNTKCEYFPCHPTDKPEDFNCLFCYCPLYTLGKQCGGNCRYLESGVKDCSACLRPHKRENYESISRDTAKIIELAKRKDNS